MFIHFDCHFEQEGSGWIHSFAVRPNCEGVYHGLCPRCGTQFSFSPNEQNHGFWYCQCGARLEWERQGSPQPRGDESQRSLLERSFNLPPAKTTPEADDLQPVGGNSKPITFVLSGAVEPKPRRAGPNGYSYSFKLWRGNTIRSLQDQANEQQLSGFPLERVSISIVLQGSHRGDWDCLARGIVDCLVQGGIVANDRPSCLRQMSIEHRSGLPKQANVSIDILP